MRSPSPVLVAALAILCVVGAAAQAAPMFTGLGDLDGGTFQSMAYDISADGSVVVGTCSAASGVEACIWDAANGMRELDEILIGDLGLDLTGWTLREAWGISDDGDTIVGMGINPSGDYEAWIATIPEPGTALLVACGLAGLAMSRRRAAS